MMRNSWLVFALGCALLTACSGYDRALLGEPEPAPSTPPPATAEAHDEQAVEYPNEDAYADSLAMFDDLRFYGSWYELYPYGMVWRPVVVSTWAPMMYGHWAWTSYGWMWVSYDPFGWAVYNYGFWANDFTLGWVWIPDYMWEPARCEWVAWDDCVGWCPLPPPGVRYKDPWERGDLDPWVTVPVTRFKETDVARYKTTPKFKSGSSERTLRREAPDAGVIERGLGRPLKVVDVQLEQQAYGAREFTRVVLPHDEQVIVEERKAEARYKSPPPPNSGGGSNSGGSGGSNDQVGPPKEKSTSPQPAKKESPPKFKEKAKEQDKSKDGEKKKG